MGKVQPRMRLECAETRQAVGGWRWEGGRREEEGGRQLTLLSIYPALRSPGS